MATNQDKKINEYKKNPTVAESAYMVGLNSNDENINIPRATLAEIVRQELYSILNASGADQGTTVTKVPVLGGNRIGSSSIADLASVLGAIKSSVSLSSGGGIINIQLGKSRSWIMVVWVNSALSALPAIIGAGRNGEVTLMAGNGNITLSDTANSFCVYKPQNNGDYITVKNNTTYNLTLSYYLILLE